MLLVEQITAKYHKNLSFLDTSTKIGTHSLDIALLIKPVSHLKKFQNSKWRPFFKMAATKYTEISHFWKQAPKLTHILLSSPSCFTEKKKAI